MHHFRRGPVGPSLAWIIKGYLSAEWEVEFQKHPRGMIYLAVSFSLLNGKKKNIAEPETDCSPSSQHDFKLKKIPSAAISGSHRVTEFTGHRVVPRLEKSYMGQGLMLPMAHGES